MKKHLTSKTGKIAVYAGVLTMLVGFFLNVATLSSVYHKTSSDSCMNTPCDVDLSGEDRLVHIGSTFIILGIAIIALATLLLIYLQIQSRKTKPRTTTKKTP